MWYDNSRLLSYNKAFNYVLGNRGGGKTFCNKKWCVNDWLKNGKQFVWVRRYETEIDEAKDGFFAKIQSLFPNNELTVKGYKAYCDGEVIGYFIPLSQQLKFKSKEFPLVNKIIFDEFLIDKGNYHYIPYEVDLFFELYETIDRLRDETRAVFIANNITSSNPYFASLPYAPNPNKRFNVYEEDVVEYFTDEEYIEAKKNTRFGRKIRGTRYGAYAIENKSLRDDDTFIEKRSKQSKFYLAFKFRGNIYGVWVDWNEGLMYIDTKYDPNSNLIYSLTKSDHSPNSLLIDSIKSNRLMKNVRMCFQRGEVRFSTQMVKQAFYEIIGLFVR